MRVFVTGGTGFVGSALIRSLIADGHEIVSCARRASSEFHNHPRVKHVQLDFGSQDEDSSAALKTALEGADVVFHIAAKVAMWGEREDFVRTNVAGTQRLLEAARAAGVARFVYTSSPSVIASGTDLSGVDESVPYPANYEAYYPETKAIAEQLVLAAHTDTFRTVALRPHLIFGPGDTNLVPAILKKASAGRLAVIGKGMNRVDFCYIDDCVLAHRCAESALARDQSAGGQPYFISQGEPLVLWDFINRILTGLGQPPVAKRVSRGVAEYLAWAFEFVAGITGKEPALTRFLVSEMATDHFFDISRARRNLGFSPTVSMAEGIARTIKAFDGKQSAALAP